ncbi:MAG: hypothetical protein V4550_02235 [Gemmatimonadota bacterium]
MRAYVITTGVVFGLLAAAHVWRIFVEGSGVAKPPFVAITVVAAALCGWALRLATIRSTT